MSEIRLGSTAASVAKWSDTSIVAIVPSGAASDTFVITANGQSAVSPSFSVTSLPAGWLDQDVGAVPKAGSATYANGTYTVQGAGNGVGTTNADGVHFVYQQLTGDGAIVVRIVSRTDTNAYVGVMFRETLDAGARSMYVGFSGGSLYLQSFYRTTPGARSDYYSVADGYALPYWLKLVRRGNSFTAFAASDGENWYQLGSSRTIDMAADVYAGLAVSRYPYSSSSSVVFDNVSLSSAADPAPVIDGVSATTASVGSSIVIGGSNFGAAQGSSVVLLNGAAVPVDSWSDTSITITIPSGASSGYLVISKAPKMNSSNPVLFTVTSQPLPTGWLDQDVGSVKTPGSVAYSGGTYTVQGAGNGVGSTNADGVHFVYQQLTGDGTIVARIVSRTDTNAYVGVMFRETLDAGAKSMYVGFSGGSLYLQAFFRTTPGARSDYYSVADGYALPYWLKLVRRGNSFTAFAASDGENWYQLGSSRTIDMAADVYAGLAVSRSSGSSSSSVVFDNVSLASAADPSPVINGISATTASVGSSIVIGGSNFGAAQGSSVVLLNGAVVPVGSWSDTSITITIPSGASSGYLVISKAPGMNSSNPVVFTVTSQPLPMGWLDQDVGSVKTPGSVAYSAGAYTVQGAGSGVDSTNADGVHLVYQQLTGDGTIVARIVSRTDTNAYVGVMFRETLDAGARSMYIGFSGSSGSLYSYYRTSAGARSDYYNAGDGYVLPYWLKLVRKGNSFTAYASPDGANWTFKAGPITVVMAKDAYAGLAVSRYSTSSSSSVVFDSVSIGPEANQAPVIRGVSSTSGSIGSTVIISGSNFGTAQGSSVVLLNGAAVMANSWSDASITITIPEGVTSGPLNVLLAPQMSSSNAVVFNVTTQPLPSGWYDRDIGIVKSGSATYSDGVFTIHGSGSLQTTVDAFHFVYQPLASDGAIVARVLSSGESAGLMMRGTLDATGTQISSTVMSGPKELYIVRRTKEGEGTSSSYAGTVRSPYCLKLVRAANTFTAFSASGSAECPQLDAAGWKQAGTAQSFTTGQTVYVGLVSLPGGSLGTTTFDNVYVVPGGPLPNPVIGTLLPAAGAPGRLVTISGSGFGSVQGASTVMFNGASATISNWSDTEIVAAVPERATTGPVSVTVGNITGKGPDFVVAFGAQLTDSLGNVTTYNSSQSGGQWMLTDSQGSGCSSCTTRNENHNQYDSKGNLLWSVDAVGHSTAYRYDSSNNVTSESLQLDGSTTATMTYTYNSFGQVLTTTDPLGHTTTNTYDSHGNLLSVTTPSPNSSTAASVTKFAYDSKGQLTQITDPLNHVTTIAYNTVGLIQSITDANSQTTSYEYDAHSNRTAVVDPLQNRTAFAYDAGDRLTTITHPGGTTTTFGYDSRGRRTSATDPNGKTTTYVYDDADRLISVTDAAQNTTQYAYDTESNLLSITDAMGRSTSFSYDAYGRVIQTTFPSSDVESYSYDAVGNMTSKTDRKGQTIRYVYDALNRMTRKTYPYSANVDYVYDLVGKIKSVSDPTGTYAFTYDNMGRLVGTTTQYAFLPSKTFTNTYTYDAASNRTGQTDPASASRTYSYDLLNRLTGLTSTVGGTFGFGYDNLSRRTSLTRPNGVNTTYSYDSLSHLQSVLHQLGGITIDGAEYTYDSAGTRTARNNRIDNSAEQYGYDAIYQLTQVQKLGSATESYTYDQVGNRLSSLGQALLSYNQSNHLLSTPSATFTYDHNGNMLTRTEASEQSTRTTSYAWDTENRLTSVTNAGGTVAFKYDPFGRRIQKSSATGTTNYVYDRANIVAEYDASGSLLARYDQGPGIDEPLAISRGGTLAFYHADGLGSVTSLTDATGSAVAAYTTDAFGKSLQTAGSALNPFRYTAREWDAETGLYYYRARYYDPNIGRFLSEDPARFDAGPDFYTYADNAPTNFLDPTGLSPKPVPPNQSKYRPCNGPEEARCAQTCAAEGKAMQSCMVSQTWRIVRWKDNLTVWGWRNGPMSCSCNEPNKPNECPKEQPASPPRPFLVPAPPQPGPLNNNQVAATGTLGFVILLLAGILLGQH